jgi:uncharacterized protein YbjT (DUF2867 family)
MTYAIAGALGNTGRVAAETLLGAGKAVRALVRDPSRAGSLRSQGAQVVAVDLLNEDALAEALEGVQGAYLLLPPATQEDDVLAHFARVSEVYVRALRRARVPHLVFLSSFAAQLEAGTGPILSVAHAERELSRLDETAVTFLRPAYFMENFASALGGIPHGVFPSFIAEGRAFPMIATRDIGRVAAERLMAGERGRSIVQLLGPEDLTIPQAAAVFAEAAKRPLQLQVVPDAQMAGALVGYGMGRDMARLYQQLTEALNRGELQFEAGHPVERTRTPLIEVARSLLAGSPARGAQPEPRAETAGV